ncbi:YkvA family protein [Leadbetterella byssophila]|uniref:DUF1232 domain-containing protein n=1 Tax=Leadbetterella byssophila (strain DSM 17132 / JCM 16389 / KACC 11308 / NBRC 106382 / 4M15) TaxID=649349 RepID=E4RY74_LEAB4|nr:YkvA family protein [Leadbetterella byssophila]ADQ17285.1 protein of unknown function DUF1232 [Leadbetterella byssophila DSM 17132]
MKKTGFLKTILGSIFFKNSFLKASRLSKNSKGIILLLGTVISKMQSDGKGSAFQKIKAKVKSLGLLLRHYANGSYRNVETKHIIFILAGMIYFLSPVDLIPDILPLVGFADDIALFSFIYNSLSKEVEKFEMWLLNQKAEVILE